MSLNITRGLGRTHSSGGGVGRIEYRTTSIRPTEREGKLTAKRGGGTIKPGRPKDI